MPEISVQHQCASLTDLALTDSFGEPVGPLPTQTDKGFFKQDNMIAGTWECEPGTLQLDLDVTEFCHLLEGHWRFTSESGKVTEVRAGDSWVFPKGWKGSAEVVEKVRKVYMMLLPE
ncbi:cupin domain-containing protein [Haliea sp. E1-2-M8]|uniref:cupin domain-containing protein n=1 Tax=Haliea sp. E1-2-M8 TaxID=3064706 RepID=UPI00271D0142|nr:cupin domain-containing protein [Haliea sp. E1-2-M8]MDO8860124.1 cupin domain-containing protein [Haliea sp. E1-2-M8]